ncbi:TRAP transporter large permease [Planococcus beigongshangi]|uniref:TRAP transporter large permease n=1 Tax=Planococcus beigongshangi TaxID=2782536 RepID=UPI00193BED20|nr:TRAP transporter large permease [Planococcus beigongshangi]
MILWILFGTFFLLLLLNIPIAVSLGIATVLSILFSGATTIDFFITNLVTSIDSFPLMAVPFFILAGELMSKGGISDRLFRFANSIVGYQTGGFAVATIVTCMFFASISGSGPATVAAIGSIMIPAMVNRGYDLKFATATVAAAGSLGVIIPPSIDMIMFGVSTNTSIGDMFIAGILPGIFIGLCLIVWAVIYSNIKGYKGAEGKISIKNILKEGYEAKWALLIPVIILGGIYGGIFTPTEAAVIAVVVGLIIGAFFYKELKISSIPSVLVKAAITSATIFFILTTATTFGKILTIEQVPQKMAVSLSNISENPLVILLLINVMLLIVGTFMETVAAIIILAPIFLPIAVGLGYDPVHFGIMMIVNLAIGFITPPLGVNLFIGSGLSGLSIVTLSKAILPYFIAMIFSLFIVIVWPDLSLFLIDLKN